MTPSNGKITFSKNGHSIEIDKVYRQLAFAAPYMDLIEEFSLHESIVFHQKFKQFQKGLEAKDLIHLLGMEKSKDKPVKFFSSGMKQRLKLVLSICIDAPLLLLDEPSTNLDEEGMGWYQNLLGKFVQNRTVIIASNIQEDYSICNQNLKITAFKPGFGNSISQ